MYGPNTKFFMNYTKEAKAKLEIYEIKIIESMVRCRFVKANEILESDKSKARASLKLDEESKVSENDLMNVAAVIAWKRKHWREMISRIGEASGNIIITFREAVEE